MGIAAVKQSFNDFGVKVKTHFQKEETKENIKKGLKITGIALACIAAGLALLAGVTALCVFFPAVGIPVVIITLIALSSIPIIY